MDRHTTREYSTVGEQGGEDITQILHQLNQPLTAIHNYAQTGSYMLENGLQDPQQLKELFNKITAQSDRCVQLSRNLQACIDAHGPVTGHEDKD